MLAIRIAFLALAGLAATPALAAIKTQTVDYSQDGVTLEGAYVWDDSSAATRPGVVVYHTYTGWNEHEMEAAERLAGMGYVAFIADIYGKGIKPESPKDAQAESSKYTRDRPLLRARAKAGLDMLEKNPMVDPARMAAIGYCFGGASALELARSGAPILATVVFHATLSSPTPADAQNIKGAVLALHGFDDPIAPAAEWEAFEKEMRDAKVDWRLVLYASTRHGFTTKSNPVDAPQNAYNAVTDERSWRAMQDLLREKLDK